MKAFAALFDAIDQTTKTTRKVEAIVRYLETATDEDRLLAIAILIGNKPKRPVKTTLLREWVSEYTGIPLWLLEESYYVVGDLGETISLLVSHHHQTEDDSYSLREVFERIIALQKMPVAQQKENLFRLWQTTSGTALFLVNKMLTGSLRVGVSKKLVVKAIAKFLDKDERDIEHQMMGKWDPMQMQFQELFLTQNQMLATHIPYPFCLAYPLESAADELGTVEDWVIEKKLDGIRGQVIVRASELFIWSRGEDLLTDKFPEFEILQHSLPDGTVIDGEIIPWKDGEPLLFSVMQTRIGRKNLTAKILKEAPLVMVCYDLLEWQGKDIRHYPLYERRSLLVQLLEQHPSEVLILSETLSFNDWQGADVFREQARSHQCEGLMLKHRESVYEVGRKKGGWWKWKTQPLTIDGVMLYAQSGHGRRANLFTDYTFAVWDGDVLIPFAKAYSGLTDKEINVLDKWIKQHTLEKFGPVRSVKPEQVFEIAFEGINKSTRHKSGVALRFPRILRWRTDKAAKDANSKEDLLQLLKNYEL